MKRAVLSILFVFGLFFLTGHAQDAPLSMSLSLQDARDYAVENNLGVQSARYDVEASRMAMWEIISSMLPAVNASGSFSDNLKLTTTLLPAKMFDPTADPDEKFPVSFGSKFNSSGSIQASLVIFNAPLIVGLETAKMARTLNEHNLSKSELDIKEMVTSTYYLILVSERSLEILEGNLSNMNEMLNSTKAMYKIGMVEETDVDQMSTSIVSVENSRTSLLTSIELNYNLLRFQLGVGPDVDITLTQDLESILSEVDVDLLLSRNFDVTQNVSFKLIEGQEKLSELSLKSQKASVLPTLAGFYNYGTSGMGDKVSDLRWFQNSMAGLSLNIPIFASGQRYSKIQKAKIELDKARNTKEQVSDQLLIQEKQLRFNLMNADIQYRSQKNNIDVAEKVYKSVENKFKQGMASSLDLAQANNQYLTAESNYVSALLTLLQSKLALDKLLNEL
ncbi:MAG: TolC family protein [Bacteroidales bacterium]|jgi:outer membrane protein